MILRSLSPIAAAVCTLLANAPAQATSLATFVSGTGTDTGTCPITAPCKTFQFAHNQTTAGGTIIVLTGGSFGGVNITKSISIVAEGAAALIDATVSCGAGTFPAAICITSGATVVHLRGLTIDLNNADQIGIEFNSGKALHVQNCVIRRTKIGVGFNASSPASELFVSNTAVVDNAATAITADASGSGSYSVTFDRVHLDNNGGAGLFVFASTGANTATVRNSVAAGNGSSGIALTASGGSVNVMIDRTVLSHNNSGVDASAANTAARIGDSTITGNVFGLAHASGGQILSYKTSDVIGNGTDGTPTGSLTMK
jgi:hypothetical protein